MMGIYYNPKLKLYVRELINNSTIGEILFWNKLKGRRMRGYQFMRQKPIGNYIVDFYCSRLRLIIEIDGKSSHRFKLTKDVQRQQWLEKLGVTVLRFEERDVRYNMDKVLYAIEDWIDQTEETAT